MPQKSSFFDSAPGDERYYPAREFAEYFTQFIGNGIFKGGTTLKVTATGKDANVSLAVGHGWINGYKYTVYDAPLVLPIQPATTQDRIDRIVLRLDTSAPVRAVQALVLQGTPAASPVAPGIVRSGDIYDLSLAQIRIKANSSIVLPENITDERLNNTVCGVVTGVVQQADTTTIFNQFQSWLNTKTAEYQKQWDDFMKSIEDSGFASTQYVDNRVLTGGYGVTTNSGNDYSVTPVPAPATLVEGLRVTIKINAANTGAATLNVKGLGKKNILKANGTALISGSLKANSVYTLVYNGTAFILQGEGGGGNVKPDQVEAGFTFTNDDGDQVGTLSKQAFVNQLVAKGVAASMSDPFNTLASKIGQIKNTLRSASGSLTVQNVDNYPYQVTNLAFKPVLIVAHVYLRIGSTYTATSRGYIYADAFGFLSNAANIDYWNPNEQESSGSSSVAIASAQFGSNSVTFTLSSRLFYASDIPYVVYGI